jgi:large subunit ribosomal protein L29
MTKAKDLRTQSEAELEAQVIDLRKEIFELRNAVSSKREDVKPYQIQMKRKDVARILTVLRARELQLNA